MCLANQLSQWLSPPQLYTDHQLRSPYLAQDSNNRSNVLRNLLKVCVEREKTRIVLKFEVTTQLLADTVRLCEFVFVRKLTEFCWAYLRKERGVVCFNSSWIFSACLVYFASPLGPCRLQGSKFRPIIGLRCVCLEFSGTYSK